MAAVFAQETEALEGAAPVFFGPCTLRRTWGTRPEPLGSGYEIKSAGIRLQSNLNKSDGYSVLNASIGSTVAARREGK